MPQENNKAFALPSCESDSSPVDCNANQNFHCVGDGDSSIDFGNDRCPRHSVLQSLV